MASFPLHTAFGDTWHALLTPRRLVPRGRYRAWIVAMNGQRKALKWSKADIVTNANLYARAVLGRTTIPTLPKKTAAECGLVGMAGLTIEENAVEAAPAEAASAVPSSELVVKFDWPAFCKMHRKDANSAKAAVLALSREATIELQAVLDKDGEAEVAGYKITSGMVTASEVPISRASSGASLDQLSRVASQTCA